MRSWTATRRGTPRQALALSSSSSSSSPSQSPATPPAHLPTLPPNSTALLLKITHVSLNPADLMLLKTIPPWLPFRASPPVPGLDFAGEIVAIGDALRSTNPDGLAVGGIVGGALGLWDVLWGRGTLSEYVVVESRLVAKVPRVRGWGGREAVGVLGVAGQTTVAMVGRVVRGDGGDGEGGMKGLRVLVNGASGGVGTLLVQACKGLGAEVVGVCSGANAALVERLGADEVVDYRLHDPVEEHLAQRFGQTPFDAIFDCAGSQPLYARSPGYLKPDGKFITIVGGWSQGVVPFVRNKLRPCLLGGTPRSYDLFLLSASGELAKQAAAWIEQGVIKEAVVGSEYPMEQAIEAYEKLATGRAKGKIVVSVASTQ